MTQPTPEELEELARIHIAYEVDRLLVWSHVQLTPDQFAGEAQHREVLAHRIAQTTLESALIHLRTLAKFLTTSRSKAHKYDVIAAHYFDGPTSWSRPAFVLGDTPEAHESAIAEIDRRLVHLTTRRVGGQSSFEWSEILSRVPIVLTHFLHFAETHASERPTRAAWFRPSTNQIRNHALPHS